jgi:LacI family transcriptional regulator
MTVVVGCGGRADIELLEIEMMVRRRMAGLLLIPTGTDKKPFKLIRDAQIPMVCFDRSLPGFEVDAVVVNNRDSSREAVNHLIQHGHKNIVCLGNQSDIYPIRHRIQGYEDGMREAGLSTVIIDRSDTVEEVECALVRLMQLKRPPSAVFTVNSIATVQLLQVAARRGYRIPAQLALIGFDDFQMATLLKPSITVVRQPVVEMSRRAAYILLDQLNNTAPHTTATVILTTELIIRESCGCRPSKLAQSPASLLSDRGGGTVGIDLQAGPALSP